MKPSGRLALVLALVLGIVFALTGPARADHQLGHDHPFCAQGGGQGGPASGGPGGTIHDNADIVLDNSGGGEPPDTFLIPEHLGDRFGEDDPRGIDDDGDGFIEIDSGLIDDDGTGSSGSAFHGGHGGGPGGGQGGSAFFGAGDGGCSPVNFDADDDRRRPVPFRPTVGRRLPITGSISEQLTIMAGLLLSLGGTMWMIGRARNPVAASVGTVAPAPTVVTVPRRAQQVVSRLKTQVKGPWVSRGDAEG
jgi:hypothetical protein